MLIYVNNLISGLWMFIEFPIDHLGTTIFQKNNIIFLNIFFIQTYPYVLGYTCTQTHMHMYCMTYIHTYTHIYIIIYIYMLGKQHGDITLGSLTWQCNIRRAFSQRAFLKRVSNFQPWSFMNSVWTWHLLVIWRSELENHHVIAR